MQGGVHIRMSDTNVLNTVLLGAPNRTIVDNTEKQVIFYRLSNDKYYEQLCSIIRNGSKETQEIIISTLRSLRNDVYTIKHVSIKRSSEVDTEWTILNKLIEMKIIEGWLSYPVNSINTLMLLRLTRFIDNGLGREDAEKISGNVYVREPSTYANGELEAFDELCNSDVQWNDCGFSTRYRRWSRL